MGTSTLTSSTAEARLLEGAGLSRLAAPGGVLLAVLIQVQATLSLGMTDLRLNSADLLLAFASPVLLWAVLYYRRELLAIAGFPLIFAFAFASLLLTVSLLIGREAMGHVSGWAMIKYAGWYVLLAYLVTGGLLSLLSDRESTHRFVVVFLAFQVFVVTIFVLLQISSIRLPDELVVFSLGSTQLSLEFPISLGPRLTGFIANPNAMGLYLLFGAGLSLAFLERARPGTSEARLLMGASAAIIAGVLLTRSIAALMALAVLLGVVFSLKLVGWRRALRITLLAGLIWGAPQIVDTARGVSVNVFSKLSSIVSAAYSIGDNGETSWESLPGGSVERNLKKMQLLTLASRMESYRQAFTEWRMSPVLGAGLGVHLHNQAVSGKQPFVQIHSTPIWLMAETGLAGAGAMAAVFMLVLVRVQIARRRSLRAGDTPDPFVSAMLLILIAWAVTSLFHEVMYQRVFWLLGGMALVICSASGTAGLARFRTGSDSFRSVHRPEVFFVIGSLQTGGAETHIARIGPRLVQRGYPVTVYNYSGVGELGEGMSKSGIKVLVPPFKYDSRRNLFVRLGLLAVSAAKLYMIFLFRRPEIVHFFLPQTYIIGGLLALAAGLPRLVMSRRSMNNYQRRHPRLRRVERILHRNMSVILGNSRRVVRQLQEEEGVPPERLALIYNGLDCETFVIRHGRTEKRQMLGVGTNSKTITIVANLIYYKGHTDLLQGLSAVRDTLPDDWHLLVVGRDDGMGKLLHDQVEHLGLAGNVSFLGRRDDVAEILSVSDLGVLCSHEEGFSNAVLEGMAAGLPMVVTDVGGNAEAVEDGVNGFVVPPHAPEALGARITKLLNDAELGRRMGQAGQRRVKHLFSLDRCVGQYEALYSAIAAGAAVPASEANEIVA